MKVAHTHTHACGARKAVQERMGDKEKKIWELICVLFEIVHRIDRCEVVKLSHVLNMLRVHAVHTTHGKSYKRAKRKDQR